MGSYYLLGNNDSPETITVKFEHIKHFTLFLSNFVGDLLSIRNYKLKFSDLHNHRLKTGPRLHFYAFNPLNMGNLPLISLLITPALPLLQ